MTAAEAVLTTLRSADGWVCGRQLAQVAGWRFGGRVHDLRVAGHDIQTSVCQCQTCQRARRRARREGRQPPYLGAYRLAKETA